MNKLLIYIITINIVSFLSMGLDKYKAKNNHWRISEKFLILLAVIGGGIGSLLGMIIFHHKTKKLLFQIIIPLSILLIIIVFIKIK